MTYMIVQLIYKDSDIGDIFNLHYLTALDDHHSHYPLPTVCAQVTTVMVSPFCLSLYHQLYFTKRFSRLETPLSSVYNVLTTLNVKQSHFFFL